VHFHPPKDEERKEIGAGLSFLDKRNKSTQAGDRYTTIVQTT
jgi:hypothetical protein